MEKSNLFDAVARERLALCDQVEGLSMDQWDTPSLCDGWRVRDVMGHLVSLQEVPTWRFLIGAFGMSGFHRRVDQFAREHGQQDPAALVSRYREIADSKLAPPIIGPIAPLADIVVHAVDMLRPLGLEPVRDEAGARVVLDALCGGLPGFTSKKTVRGLRFETTDLDWSIGEGSIVRGTVSDLLVAVSGRPEALSALEGDGAPVLAARLT